MGKENSIELEAFLPKYTQQAENDGGNKTESNSADFELVRRTKVRFCTSMRWTGDILGKEAVYVFGKTFTIKEAADFAIANYPVLEKEPEFPEVCVYFLPNGKLMANASVPVTDLTANVHSMFGPDDTMIITNDALIFKKSDKRDKRTALIILLSGVLSIVGIFIIIGYANNAK